MGVGRVRIGRILGCPSERVGGSSGNNVVELWVKKSRYSFKGLCCDLRVGDCVADNVGEKLGIRTEGVEKQLVLF